MKEYIGKITESLSGADKREIIESFLTESSLSRIWQHVEDPKRVFGVISAFRGEYKRPENNERHKRLMFDIRDLGYGYIEMDGGYLETVGDKVQLVEEMSFYLPGISYKHLIELGNKYEQESVIYKGLAELKMVATSDHPSKPVGATLVDFYKGGGRRNIDLNKEAVKEFFSALLKGSHRGRKFVFKNKPLEQTAGVTAEALEGKIFFFIREHSIKSVMSHYYQKEPRRFFIYREEVKEVKEEGWY